MLLARLYPDGLGFLELAWVEEHAESERRLPIVEEEQLREELERLVGEPFVAELFEAHEAYGKALGITEEKQPAPEISMVEPLRMMVQLISDYALQVLAFGKLDPDKAVAARRALAPIDAFRQAASKRGNGRRGRGGRVRAARGGAGSRLAGAGGVGGHGGVIEAYRERRLIRAVVSNGLGKL